MLLRRERHHGKRRIAYGFAGLIALIVGGVWVAQMGFLFQTASSEDFRGNFLKMQSDIESGMEFGNAQIGSQYPEITKTPDEKLDEISADVEGSVTGLKTQLLLNAAAQQAVERLNASANAEEEVTPTDSTTPEPVAQ